VAAPLTQPSVKGTLLLGVVVQVRRLVRAGRVGADELEVKLEPGDLALLEQKILPSSWYPVSALERMLELVWAKEGGRRPEFLREQGRASAEALAAAGIYRQLAASSGRRREPDAFGRLLCTLSSAMYDFMEWRHLGGPRGVTEVDGAADWPDVLRIATEGFIEHAVRHAGGLDVRVTSERPTRDRVVFYVEPARP